MTDSLYLNLVKRAVMGYLEDADDGLDPIAREDGLVSGLLRKAHTMIGHKRLNSLQNHMEAVLRDNIPGDFVECGVWRGGASIFMRAILKEYGVTDRSVWVVDSFQGLHIPDYDKFPDEQRNPRVPLWEQEWLRISMDEVKRNFQRYELLDDQVKFVSGWVEDTLPTCPIDKLAVLRIDVDMYEPTKVVLDNLYPKLSVGGFCDLDDYPIMKPVVRAVDDYRSQFVVNDKITVLDGYTGAYWRKER